MHRNWIGIRVSGVLAVLGSLGLLLLALLTLIGTLLAPPRAGVAPAVPLAAIGMVTSSVFVLLSALGIWSAVALFRHRPWSRISFLVFAATLGLIGVSSFFIVLVMPFPAQPDVSQTMMDNVRRSIALAYALLAAIGAWWLILFNLRSTKEYFGQDPSAPSTGRPMSVSVIGWYLLVSSLMMAAGAVIRWPALLLGTVLTGWGAMAVYAALAALQILLGYGLLRLVERARLGAIGYFGFIALNSAICLAPPGLAARLEAVERQMPSLFPAGVPPQSAQMTAIFMAIGIAIAIVPICFLVRRRAAFLDHPPPGLPGADSSVQTLP